MIRPLRSILNPAAYHGYGQKPPFFEGWYYKIVDASQQHRLAVIPGIFLSEDPSRHHAFVQVLDGATGQVTYHRYPAEEFVAADGVLDLQIGPNRFTAEHMSLAIDAPDLDLHGELHFSSLTPWPVTLASPGIMGWYAWVPFMECYHGVVSLDHGIQGTLAVNGAAVDFSSGRGYIEKDWGRSFPQAWIWCQTNHFEELGTSLSASVAIIPWVRRSFPGFIVGLWHNGRLYRFATYSGAQIERLEIDDSQVTWVVGDGRHRLEMVAMRSRGGLLHAPTTVDMGRRIVETLTSTVETRLYALPDKAVKAGAPSDPGTRRADIKEPEMSLVFRGIGRHAGLEAVGDLARLRALWAGQ
jgi:hypothetical protein